MTRFIKIFATLAGLTLMTACGNTQGLIDALTAAVSSTDRTAVACVQNPFNQLCDGNETYQSTRDAIERSCTDNPNTSDNCVNFVAFLCIRDNPYHRICTQGENDYSSVQEQITSECIRDGEGPLCDRAIAAVCTNDAFDRLCLTDLANAYNQGALVAGGQDVIGFSAARARVCDPVTGSAPDSQQCGSFVRATCDRNPLDAVCANRDEYFVARDHACWIQGLADPVTRVLGTRTPECAEIHRVNNLASNAIPACRANYVGPTGANRFNPRCYNVVIGICNLNPFEDICEENSNFTNRHVKIIIDCRAQEPDATFCAEAKTSVCDDNPFDALCFLDYTSSNHPTNNDYESERGTAINDCRTNFVAGDRCAGAAEQFCVGKTEVTDLFNALCLNDPNTDTVRQPTCVSERAAVVEVGDNPITARCATTATRICDATPLDALCEDVAGYRAAQFNGCVQNPDHPSCAAGTAQFSYITPIIACLSNPFGADCVNPTTEAGIAFASNLETAQDAYCESGGARTTSTTVVTTADRVNCTNIGSSPVFADLARNITQNGIRTYSPDGSTVTANEVSAQNPNIGGFLRTGVFGTKLGDYIGKNSGDFTDETNNGNFDRETDIGNKWLGFPDAYSFGGSLDAIWEGARRDDPADEDTADPKDGFTYFLARKNDGSGNDLAYAGIWQTTNFGAPLAVQPADSSGNITAIWAGNFTGYSGAPRLTAKPTNFYVDFTDRTFNIHNPAENANPKTGTATLAIGSGSALNDPAYYEASTFSFAVNGIFGVGVTDPNILYTNGGVARTLNAGELSGNVTYVNSKFNSREDWLAGTTISENTTVMPLTGLIGVEGALGIFLNPAETASALAGGFTATAPTPAE